MRLQLDRSPLPIAEVAPATAPPGEGEDPWDVVSRFLRDLENCTQAPRQDRLALEAVRDAVRADAVFLYDPSPAQAVEPVGETTPPPEWCRAFAAEQLRAARAAKQLLVPAVPPGAAGLPAPQSAALVRLSKTRGSWIVALAFRPGRRFGPADLKVMTLARHMLSQHRRHTWVNDNLRNTLIGLVHCLTAALDAKDPYTCGHSERVTRIAVRLGRQMGLPPTTLDDLYLGGLLHDVGKIGVPDHVLRKPGKLTDEEFTAVQQHTLIGDRIVANVAQLASARPAVRNHHENFDGTGYPDRLAGKDIPLLARILAVADAYDAMNSDRPYRKGLPSARIDAVLTAGAGKQWDPEVIRHFMACKGELFAICQKGIGDSIGRAVDRVLDVDAGRFAPSRLIPTGDAADRRNGSSPDFLV
jgi:HD-GYP domain-containing protein (c-di-GMP phosphodiesterase class II)